MSVNALKQEKPSPWKNDLLFILLLLSFSVIPLCCYIASGLGIKLTDPENLCEWMPYRMFANRAFSQGVLPTWCPDLVCGFPFIGWSHSSTFAPSGLIYYFLPYGQAAVISLFLHQFIFNAGLYYLLRIFRVSPFGSFVSVTGIGFYNYLLIEQVHYLPGLFSFSLTPIIFAFLYRTIERAGVGYLFLFSLATAIQLSSGDMEIFTRSVLLELLAGVLYVLIFRPAPASIVKAVFLSGAGLILAGLISMVQIIPTAELVFFATRRYGFPYRSFIALSGWWITFWFILFIVFNPLVAAAVLLWPLRFFRDRWLTILILLLFICFAISQNLFDILKLVHHVPVLSRMGHHVHMMILGAIPMGILAGKVVDFACGDRTPRGFCCIFLCVFILSLAGALLFMKNGNPSHLAAFLPWLYVSVIVVAISAIACYLIAGRGSSLPRTWLRLLMCLLVVLYLASSFSLLSREPSEPAGYKRAYTESLARMGGIYRTHNIVNWNHLSTAGIPIQSGVYQGTQSFDFFIHVLPMWSYEFFSLIKDFWFDFDYDQNKFVLPAHADGTYWLPGEKFSYIDRLFFVFKMGDFIHSANMKHINFMNVLLFASDHQDFPLVPDRHFAYQWTGNDCRPHPCMIEDSASSGLGTPAVHMPAGSAISQSLLPQNGDRLRFGVMPGPRTGTGHASVFAIHGKTVESSEPFILFLQTVQDGESPQPDFHEFDLSSWEGQQLEITFSLRSMSHIPGAGISGVWVDPVLYRKNTPFRKIAGEGDVRLYLNQEALPRSYLLHRAVVIPDRRDRLEYMKSPEFDPGREVVLEKKPLQPVGPEGGRDTVDIMDYLIDRVSLRTDIMSPGVLVLSDTWFPGWRAFDNGREVQILRANHAFRGVLLDSGPHRVEFLYQPRSLEIGMFVSIASLFMLCGVVVFRKVVKGRRVRCSSASTCPTGSGG